MFYACIDSTMGYLKLKMDLPSMNEKVKGANIKVEIATICVMGLKISIAFLFIDVHNRCSIGWSL